MDVCIPPEVLGTSIAGYISWTTTWSVARRIHLMPHHVHFKYHKAPTLNALELPALWPLWHILTYCIISYQETQGALNSTQKAERQSTRTATMFTLNSNIQGDLGWLLQADLEWLLRGKRSPRNLSNPISGSDPSIQPIPWVPLTSEPPSKVAMLTVYKSNNQLLLKPRNINQ